VGHALTWLRARDILDKTIVVLLSDHGEGLGDHGEDEHGLLAYDSTLRVPWIVRVPEQPHRGGRIEQHVGLVDVMPTILGLLAIEPPDSLDGVDVSPLIASGADVSATPLYAETYYPRLQFNWSELTSVRDGRYKFIRAPRAELYEYRTDPSESRNLITERGDVAARFARVLDNMRHSADAVPVAKPLDAEAAQRLSSLGYVSSAASTPSSGALPDPKDRLETYRGLSRARELLAVGDERAGVALLEAIVLQEPELTPARELLRKYWLPPPRVRRGLEWFCAAARKRPDPVPLLVEVATSQRAIGRIDESAATLDTALSRAPDSVEVLLAAAETHRAAGRFERAVELFRTAATLTSDPTPMMRVAETLTRMGRLDEAGQIVKDMLALHPQLGGAHYLLAFIAEQRGNFAEADREYRAEMSLSPWDHRAVFNLALLTGQRGDFRSQLHLLETIPRLAPEFGDVHFYIAKALLDLGDRSRFPEAVAAARRGLKLAPASTQAPLGHYVLADIFMLEGKQVDAARELRLGKALEQRVGAPGGGPLPAR
jgi:tetratricopeptide (TPR) repeat protein